MRYHISVNSNLGVIDLTLYEWGLYRLVTTFVETCPPMSLFRWEHPQSYITYSLEYSPEEVWAYSHRLNLFLWQHTISMFDLYTLIERACVLSGRSLRAINLGTHECQIWFETPGALQLPRQFLTSMCLNGLALQHTYNPEELFIGFIKQWLKANYENQP